MSSEQRPGLMAGKRGLIMGLANDKSIAWGIAKALAAEGAELAFSYQGDALKKRVDPLAAQLESDTVLATNIVPWPSFEDGTITGWYSGQDAGWTGTSFGTWATWSA